MLFTPPSAVRRPTRSSHRVPALVGIAALGAGLMTTAQPVAIGQASLGTCGSDPVVVLSNGVTIDLNSAISDTESDVQQVAYTLHAPSGTSVISVIYTSGLIGPKEVLRFFADNLPDTYDTTTKVSTYTTHIAVTTATSVVPVLTWPAAASTSGYDQQYLHVSVTV